MDKQAQLQEMVMDKLTKVCICKSINRATMKKAIAGGAHDVIAVKKATGAGNGSCHGRRCTPKIAELLEQQLSMD